jgi:hypothetical protein
MTVSQPVATRDVAAGQRPARLSRISRPTNANRVSAAVVAEQHPIWCEVVM